MKKPQEISLQHVNGQLALILSTEDSSWLSSWLKKRQVNNVTEAGQVTNFFNAISSFLLTKPAVHVGSYPAATAFVVSDLSTCICRVSCFATIDPELRQNMLAKLREASKALKACAAPTAPRNHSKQSGALLGGGGAPAGGMEAADAAFEAALALYEQAQQEEQRLRDVVAQAKAVHLQAVNAAVDSGRRADMVLQANSAFAALRVACNALKSAAVERQTAYVAACDAIWGGLLPDDSNPTSAVSASASAVFAPARSRASGLSMLVQVAAAKTKAAGKGGPQKRPRG